MAERYGWTPSQIAELTPAQQLMLLEDGQTDANGIRTFATEAEYRRFLRSVSQ